MRYNLCWYYNYHYIYENTIESVYVCEYLERVAGSQPVPLLRYVRMSINNQKIFYVVVVVGFAALLIFIPYAHTLLLFLFIPIFCFFVAYTTALVVSYVGKRVEICFFSATFFPVFLIFFFCFYYITFPFLLCLCLPLMISLFE